MECLEDTLVEGPGVQIATEGVSLGKLGTTSAHLSDIATHQTGFKDALVQLPIQSSVPDRAMDSLSTSLNGILSDRVLVLGEVLPTDVLETGQ